MTPTEQATVDRVRYPFGREAERMRLRVTLRQVRADAERVGDGEIAAEATALLQTMEDGR